MSRPNSTSTGRGSADSNPADAESADGASTGSRAADHTPTGNGSDESAPTASGSEHRHSTESADAASAIEPTVRCYVASDLERFLSLYETVWGKRKAPAWFEWRFLENPTVSGVEMVVAEADGQLVGAEPLVPYRLRVGDDGPILEARQPVDWIVHPEYRRMGIFGAMTERLLEEVTGEAALLFNFPNEALRPGIERFGWRTIDAVGARYRVQNPRVALLMSGSSRTRSAATRIANLGSPIVRGGLGVLDRIGATSDDVTVDRSRGVPVETVQSLYAANVPDRIHVPRNRPFLEWRFTNPRWDVETYVVSRHGEAVASGVFATESIEGDQLVRLLDVQPMTEPAGDADAFEALLAAVVADHPRAAVFKLPTGLYPAVCRRYGFVRDDVVPFARLSATTYHAVRPLDGAPSPDENTTTHDSTVGDAGTDGVWDSTRTVGSNRSYDLADPADWLLAPGDVDVA